MFNTIEHINKENRNWLKSFYFIHKLSFRTLWARKASWVGTFIFSCCLLILFPFGLGTEALQRADIQIGTFWIMNEFVAVLTISRIFSAEQECNGMDLILTSKLQKTSIIAGKISFTAFQIFTLQIPILLLWIIFYNINSNILVNLLNNLFFVSIFFNLGSASLGTLITCLTARSLAKEILLPMLFFPLQSGILLASVSLTIHIGNNSLLGAFSESAWWTILIAYPIIFSTLGILLSDLLLQE
ncbi:heme exporter protein CcmB [Pigmentibacter ruber]|uniref:heme exporter protein CcmB n=1 Tax=Pigmentibacter ruber TaxID=2683196 RepID=UPI00131BFE3D|nr:heme exporter protein CcmB [Pigmentibacter ruber]BFD33404.1 hypothetical protein GTC16762_30220 [Pigmentibacter ruber]